MVAEQELAELIDKSLQDTGYNRFLRGELSENDLKRLGLIFLDEGSFKNVPKSIYMDPFNRAFVKFFKSLDLGKRSHIFTNEIDKTLMTVLDDNSYQAYLEEKIVIDKKKLKQDNIFDGIYLIGLDSLLSQANPSKTDLASELNKPTTIDLSQINYLKDIFISYNFSRKHISDLEDKTKVKLNFENYANKYPFLFQKDSNKQNLEQVLDQNPIALRNKKSPKPIMLSEQERQRQIEEFLERKNRSLNKLIEPNYTPKSPNELALYLYKRHPERLLQHTYQEIFLRFFITKEANYDTIDRFYAAHNLITNLTYAGLDITFENLNKAYDLFNPGQKKNLFKGGFTKEDISALPDPDFHLENFKDIHSYILGLKTGNVNILYQASEIIRKNFDKYKTNISDKKLFKSFKNNSQTL